MLKAFWPIKDSGDHSLFVIVTENPAEIILQDF